MIKKLFLSLFFFFYMVSQLAAFDLPQEHFDFSFSDMVSFNQENENPLIVKKSILTFKRLLISEPRNTSYLLSIAENYLSISEFQLAREYLLKAISANSKNTRAYVLLNEVYFKIDKKQEALDFIINAVRSDFLNPMLHFLLASDYYELAMFDEAADSFKKVIEIDPMFVGAYYYLGLINVKLCDYIAAENYFSKTIFFSIDFFRAANNLAMIKLGNKEYSESKKLLEGIVLKYVNYEYGYLNLGYLNLILGNYEQAGKNFKSALKINPDRLRTHYLIGVTYQQLNQLDMAIKSFEYLADNATDKQNHIQSLLKLLKANKNYSKALRYSKQLLDIDKKNAYFLLEYALLLIKNGNNDAALHFFLKAIELKPTYSKAYFELSKYYALKIDIKNALDCFFKSGSYLSSSLMIIISAMIFIVVFSLVLNIFILTK